MLPFLMTKKNNPGVLVQDRKPDHEPSESEELSALEAAMEPLLKAMESKDHKAMAQAFLDAFLIADASPHEEYEHEDEAE